MKSGDIWSWALSTMSAMMLFLAANCILLNAIGADKYRGAFAMIIFSVWAGAIHIVALGLLSLAKRSSQPILGAIVGIGLFGLSIFALTALLFVIIAIMAIISPDHKCGVLFRVFTGALFIGVPILALGYSIIRKPNIKRFQQEVHLTASPDGSRR